MFQTPIAFILFNRPRETQIAFDVIRSIRPTELFLISDAARENRELEPLAVEKTRQIVADVDWPCQVRRIYAEANMGCGKRISSGITAAFEEVDRLIVLEDDCVAHPTFFPYAECLLDRYEDDPRVMAVSGDCFHSQFQSSAASYYFSKYPHCWGWATWKRAWSLFQSHIPDWRQIILSRDFESLCHSTKERNYWLDVFERIARGRIDTWDFQWTLTCWKHQGLTALPKQNLISNIGFNSNGTHTQEATSLANLPTFPMDIICHPDQVLRDLRADQVTDEQIFSGPWREPGPMKRITNKLRSLRRRNAA
ncbi:MAG: glycosyltransferase family 2 protein [Rubripirellula sp.]